MREQQLHATFLKRYADKALQPTPATVANAAATGRGYAIKRITQHRFTADGDIKLKVLWVSKPPSSTWEPLPALYKDSARTVNGYIASLDKEDEDKALLRTLVRSLPRPTRHR